ncbi:uncharacterized protein LOC128239273 isoform X3 [Mya arenaria]|uniref:uncharacterized protein LOC128239273 isoform X3 n=1 Tax=Mya arenaria TaxID=6604 RepID=UPI0022E41BD3|nr:uncharacterized protein LOC128239273 isoform X3 [Mya arenaria]
MSRTATQSQFTVNVTMQTALRKKPNTLSQFLEDIEWADNALPGKLNFESKPDIKLSESDSAMKTSEVPPASSILAQNMIDIKLPESDSAMETSEVPPASSVLAQNMNIKLPESDSAMETSDVPPASSILAQNMTDIMLPDKDSAMKTSDVPPASAYPIPLQGSSEADDNIDVGHILSSDVEQLSSCEQDLLHHLETFREQFPFVDSPAVSESEDESEIEINIGKFLQSESEDSESDPECESDPAEEITSKGGRFKENEIIRDIEYPNIFMRKHLKRAHSSSGQAYKKKHDRVYDNFHYCFFCKKMNGHIPVHMKTHRNIKEVADELRKEKPDFTRLRKMGDDLHNREVVESKEGELVVSRRSSKDLLDVSKYGPCINCFEWVQLSGLKKHYKKCVKGKTNGLGKKDLVLKAQILAGHIKGNLSKMMKEEVFRIMKTDDVTKTAQSDMLILLLGESWLRRSFDNVEKRKYYTSGRMRLCARLLNALNADEQNESPSCSRTKTMWDFLVPSYFDNFVRASLSVSMPNMDDLDDLKAPSNAIKLKYDIRRLVNAKYACLLKGNDTDIADLKSCKRFLTLMEIEWAERVTKIARTVLQARQLTEKKDIPAPGDVEMLTKHLASELQTTEMNTANFHRLVQLCQTRLLLFNKRRSGELEVLDLQSFVTRSSNLSDLDASIAEDLTAVEKHLLDSQGLMMIRGKRGKPVPVIIPKDADKPLAFIANLEARLAAGVQSSNKYLFANKAHQYVRAYDSLKSVCEELALKAPSRITSVSMRKYMATLTQLMGLDKYQLDWVCKHLGHTKSVHKTAYQQMSGMVERVYISKLLLIQDLNLTRKFQGQNLEEIDVADLLTEHQGWTPNMSNTAAEATELPTEYNSGSDIEVWEKEESSGEDSDAVCQPKRKKAAQSTRQKWSEKEVEELKKFFKTYLDVGITPRQDAIKKALEKSKKENGALWRRKSHLIIKKISNMNKNKRK